MLAEYKRKANIGVGLGFIAQGVGIGLETSASLGNAVLALIAIFGGVGLFIWGCAQYARGKGHSEWFGALGVLSIIGLIALVLLTDKHKEVTGRGDR